MSDRKLAAHERIGQRISYVLPWVIEAGNPFFEWFIGGSAVNKIAAEWMARPSSEISVERTHVASERGEIVGGFIAIAGSELPECRIADGLAALKELDGANRPSVVARLAEARSLFPPVDPPDLYLSRLGVALHHRGQGIGRRLIRRFVDQGLAAGHRRFRLDVWAGNGAAIDLYRSVGFRLLAESTGETSGLTYLAMALERPPDPSRGGSRSWVP